MGFLASLYPTPPPYFNTDVRDWTLLHDVIATRYAVSVYGQAITAPDTFGTGNVR